MKGYSSVLLSVFISLMICVFLFPVDIAAWPVPDTGQIACYNDTEAISSVVYGRTKLTD